MSKATTQSIDPDDWFVIAIDTDLEQIERDVQRLEECYPGRYDIRVGHADGGELHEVAVRHRE